MTTGWSHPKGLSPAQVRANATRAEEARKTEERRDAMRPTGKNDLRSIDEYSSPDLTGRSTNKGSSSGSVSRSFDYTGMDEASKVAQALQAAEGSIVDVALSDPMKIPALQNSIRSMQQYLAAYHSGNGLPPVRVSSESISSSSSPGSTSQSFNRKKLSTEHLAPKQEENPAGPQQPAPVPGPGPADAPGNDQLALGQVLGIPPHVDKTADPRTVGAQKTLVDTDKPKQGPPMPGLQHSASLWDLDYYV
jgi:hypothetical protein